MATPLRPISILLALLSLASGVAEARTVHRCYRDGTVSLSTAPEPGSRCRAITYDDNAAKLPDLWGAIGQQRGTLYERQQDGRTVYSTRNLPGSRPVLGFTVKAPAGSPAHAGLGTPGEPRIEPFAKDFAAAAKAHGIEDAWLRAIAHVESGFDASARSEKGALGVMQLMPDTARLYGVADPLQPGPAIRGAAKHLRDLLDLYEGDLSLVAAAYNAGVGAVRQYRGIPPYPETRDYVAKVLAMHARYREALAAKPKP